MPRDRKAVESALGSKGFVRVEGDHHYFVYVTRDGRKTRARTKTSHSPRVRDIADNLLAQMARQCLLTKADSSGWSIAPWGETNTRGKF